MRTSLRARAAVMVVGAALAALAFASVAYAATTAVSIENFRYTPAQLTVNVGDTLRWTNNDTAVHTATSDTFIFDSRALAKGQSFSFTFTKAGTYAYHCTVHPAMRASVVVAATATGQTGPRAPTTAPTTTRLPSTSTAPSSDLYLLPIAGLGAGVLTTLVFALLERRRRVQA